MKTILVPLDGSTLAEQVLPSVRMLAPILGANVRLLQVVLEIDQYYLAMDFELSGAFASQSGQRWNSWDVLRQSAEGYLERQAAQLRAAGVEASVEVRLGAPAEIIVEVAEREQAALIAMATHGYSGIKRWSLGSVTDKVVQATTTPVFVVPGSAAPVAEPRLKRILLALDGSAFARQALPLATELTTHARAELLLFRAVLPTVEVYHGTLLPADVQNMLHDHAQAELRAFAGELRPYEIPIKTAVVIGYPAEEIVAAAARHQVDLIVMATHGYSGLKRWALGSVADKVLHATPAPLLLVHARA